MALRFAVLAALPLVLGQQAAQSRFGPHDVRAVFVIGKSDDRNQVQYGIRLDAECVPVGDEPVYAYWRNYEKGGELTEDLNWMDRKAYAVKGQWVRERSPAGSKVLLTLKATDERGIAIMTKKQDGKCVAEAVATIDGQPAKLEKIFLQLKGWASVDYIDISGVRLSTGKPVTERVKR